MIADVVMILAIERDVLEAVGGTKRHRRVGENLGAHAIGSRHEAMRARFMLQGKTPIRGIVIDNIRDIDTTAKWPEHPVAGRAVGSHFAV